MLADGPLDAPPTTDYIAKSMELLLLISAFLSALTGAITGVRPQEVRSHQTLTEARARHVAVPRIVRARALPLLQALPALAEVAREAVYQNISITGQTPLYMARRRE